MTAGSSSKVADTRDASDQTDVEIGAYFLKDGPRNPFPLKWSMAERASLVL
jgi:hypothetical protein